jgi:hypothetical protein
MLQSGACAGGAWGERTLPGFWLLKKYEKSPRLPVFENAPQIGLYAPRLVGSAHAPGYNNSIRPKHNIKFQQSHLVFGNHGQIAYVDNCKCRQLVDLYRDI